MRFLPHLAKHDITRAASQRHIPALALRSDVEPTDKVETSAPRMMGAEILYRSFIVEAARVSVGSNAVGYFDTLLFP